MSKMNVTIKSQRGPRGVRFNVFVEGAPLRTKFRKVRSFGTELVARKEVARLLGNDVIVLVLVGSPLGYQAA
jgi:hypothetical protein